MQFHSPFLSENGQEVCHGPPAFEGFMLLKSFAIPLCPKVMLGISGCVGRMRGRVSRFSAVNTDVNWLTKALALLVSVAAGIPVGVCSVGMPWLSFRRDFMYDQNGLGFSFSESPNIVCR